MSEKMNRRSFLKTSAAIGATSLMGGSLLPGCGEKEIPAIRTVSLNELSIVTGSDYFASTVKAVEQLGSMSTFVPQGSDVAILANPQRNNPGAFTHPAVVAAAIRMCRNAGARVVNCISWLPEKNWEDTGLKKVVEKEGGGLIIIDRTDESQFRPVPVPMGKALKEARIMKPLFDHNVLIDMPITKDHAGNKFTGTMKNLMGLNSPKSNRTFHKENWQTDINSITHLDQCIADLNTVITPTLCIVDATEFITTNGPFGPGELMKPEKVIAGTDRVAIDSFCCTLWGLKAVDIIMINKGYEHGLGEIDLTKINIKDVSI